MDRPAAIDALRRICSNIESVIRGKSQVIESAVLTIAANGHLLIEDAPGLGKTVLAKSISRSIDATFKRVQATPDLLPSDITGVAIFNQRSQEFQFIPGPVFANILVVDEINRTTPRTQAALLEAMEERQVTAEGMTRPVPSPFFVIATQNPLEYHGTYPLPEGQLDRFLMATSLGYLEPPDEREVIRDQLLEHPIDRVGPVVTLNEVEEIQARVRETRVETPVLDYVLAIITATRSHPELVLGAGPRGSLSLTRAAQAKAMMAGRDFVLPDDVKTLAPLILGHRVVAKPQLRLGPMGGKSIIEEVLKSVPVPVNAAS